MAAESYSDTCSEEACSADTQDKQDKPGFEAFGKAEVDTKPDCTLFAPLVQAEK